MGDVIFIISVGAGTISNMFATLKDANPTAVSGSGGGRGTVTVTDTNPAKVVGAGGGRGNVTLTDTNPSVAIT